MKFRDLEGTILQFNKELISFKIKEGFIEEVNVLSDNTLPFEFYQMSKKEALIEFLEDRLTPETRINLWEDAKMYGMIYPTADERLRFSHGVIVWDGYWIRFPDEVLTYEELKADLCKCANK